jgi:hypothetical protein
LLLILQLLICLSFFSAHSATQPAESNPDYPIRSFVERNSDSINAATWGLIATQLSHHRNSSFLKKFFIGSLATYFLLVTIDNIMDFIHSFPFALLEKNHFIESHQALFQIMFWGLFLGIFMNRDKALHGNSSREWLRSLGIENYRYLTPRVVDNPAFQKGNLLLDVAVLGPLNAILIYTILRICILTAHLPANLVHALLYRL